ncbi:MAG TPA: glycosyltransferase family 39 protein [Syntrophales bacterium]|nr:glycosyltransferase family 39 protein [Syntrophales bacterium]HPX10715.1 glycosyltransferase family 39 protein [Syntrophales bacterium]HQB29765.1 glycosyltransferase family 39 protein [Syntrophales bacterium]HQN78903.1 glycosyltransferase family 39 protein [Syntrophales bacterium]HQQ27792.1 glycosyltransferase family 39 protein [Syntrophales bacterium]
MSPGITGWLQRALVLIVVPLILYGALLPSMPLLEPDEGRYSAIPQEMNRSGDYITPRLHGVVYLEKPPLSYWMTAIFFRLFGEGELTSRLWTGLCAWGMILLTYAMGARFFNRRAGLFAAAVLTTSVFHFLIGRINILDMPLAFFVTLAAWAGFRFVEEEGRRKFWVYLLYLASALAFLTKGLIGVVFPFAILFFWMLAAGKWRFLPRLISPAGIAVFLLVALPWLVLVQWANPDFFRFFFIQEHFLRYTTTMHDRDAFFLYYLPVVLLGFIPWLPFLWRVFRESRFRGPEPANRWGLSFLLAWLAFVFVFFSISSSKLIPYAAPLFPPLAVLIGVWFGTWAEGSASRNLPPGSRRWPVVIQSAVLIAVMIVPPFLTNLEALRELAFLFPFSWLLKVLPPVLVLAALSVLPYRMERFGRTAWFFSIYLLSALFLGSVLFPLAGFLTPYKTALPVALAARDIVPKGEPLYQFQVTFYGIDFYDGVRTPIVDDFGELEYGMNRLPPEEKARFFLTTQEFFELLREKKELYAVTQYARRVAVLKRFSPRLEELWTNGAFSIFRVSCGTPPGTKP